MNDRVWKLVQEHEEASTEQLLDVLYGVQEQVRLIRPLSQEVIMGLVKKMV